MTEELKTPIVEDDNTESFEDDKENDNSTDSSSETTEEENAETTDGDDNQSEDDKKPFHEHPRWKERDEEWKTRFNDQETRHQEDLKKIREDFAPKAADATPTAIPSWFGGDDEQWKAYQADRSKDLEEAATKARESLTKEKEGEDGRIKEANDFFKSELESIQSDKDLNPGGAKVDPNKLLKAAMDNDLVDSKGRWNYRAAYKLMGNKAPTTDKVALKKLAAATNSSGNAEEKNTTFKTGDDFKGQNRPW